MVTARKRELAMLAMSVALVVLAGCGSTGQATPTPTPSRLGPAMVQVENYPGPDRRERRRYLLLPGPEPPGATQSLHRRGPAHAGPEKGRAARHLPAAIARDTRRKPGAGGRESRRVQPDECPSGDIY